MTVEFVGWPKTARLYRDVTISEKIDGTNAAVGVTEDGAVYAQSRKRLITPEDDNFNFARWTAENAGTLADTLGPGLHFGEWWGSGIQRGYGLEKGEKRFALFNTRRWLDSRDELAAVPGLGLVPVLYRGVLTLDCVASALAFLRAHGSVASPGFNNPEGVCLFHEASNVVYKVTLDNDGVPKSALDAA